jgi:hypothetical protein
VKFNLLASYGTWPRWFGAGWAQRYRAVRRRAVANRPLHSQGSTRPLGGPGRIATWKDCFALIIEPLPRHYSPAFKQSATDSRHLR